MFLLSLTLMVYGLAGVFFALAVLYVFNCLIVRMFPVREEKERE